MLVQSSQVLVILCKLSGVFGAFLKNFINVVYIYHSVMQIHNYENVERGRVPPADEISEEKDFNSKSSTAAAAGTEESKKNK